uniref:Uncharacterized protein n=1 Tax=Pseudomonas phage HRDY3 TaxID=3236930 RepID=A0AB39CDM2_9VIRU
MKNLEAMFTRNMLKKIFSANIEAHLITNAKVHAGLKGIWQGKVTDHVDMPGEGQVPYYFVADKVSETQVDISLYTQDQVIEALKAYSPVGRTSVVFEKPADFRFLSPGRYAVYSEIGLYNAGKHFAGSVVNLGVEFVSYSRGPAPERYPAFVELRVAGGDSVVVERSMPLDEMDRILKTLSRREDLD